MIRLKKEEKEEIIREIQYFYQDEREEEIGALASEILLDFITLKLGKFYYNKGVQDSEKYLKEKLSELSEIEKY
jgi:uncharacterized protein (DUF2164 family)